LRSDSNEDAAAVAADNNMIGVEAEVIFAQDHNILAIILVPILSLEFGGLKIQKAPLEDRLLHQSLSLYLSSRKWSNC
jgi:hypothetical protein